MCAALQGVAGLYSWKENGKGQFRFFSMDSKCLTKKGQS